MKDKIKRLVAQYLSKDKPEPNLVVQANNLSKEDREWMKENNFERQGEFWVISRDNARKIFEPSTFDYDAHWKAEKELRLAQLKKGLGL